MNSVGRFHAFGPYTVDATKGLLWRDGKVVPVARKTFQVLMVLIDHRGDVVQKDEIFRCVWPDTIVEENNLFRHIATLRKILGDRSDDHRFVSTVPGHGYQFVADVTVLPSWTPSPSTDPEASEHPTSVDTGAASVEGLSLASGSTHGSLGPRLLLATLLATVAIGAGSLYLFVPRGGSVGTQNGGLRVLTHERGLQQEPSWSPDGTSLVYASDREGTMNLWVQPIDGAPAWRLTSSTAQESQPSWSPDGHTIAFRSERDGGGIYVIGSSGGAERRLTTVGFDPRWSPDGTRLLLTSVSEAQQRLNFQESAKVFVVDANRGQPVPIGADALAGVTSPHAAWAPDGQSVAVWGQERSSGWVFLTIDLMRGTPTRWMIDPAVLRRISDEGLMLSRFEWSRSGRYLYFQGDTQGVRNIWRVTLAPSGQRWLVGPERLTDGPGYATNLALSPDGSRLAFSVRSEQTRLWSFPFDTTLGKMTGAGAPMTSGGADERDPAAAFNGSMLVYRTVRSGRQDLWQRSLSNGRERLLLDDQQWQRSNPHWSYDGTQLVYARARLTPGGARVEPAIVVLPADGGDEHVVAATGERQFGPTDWSPDGRSILGSCRPAAGAPSAVCLLPLSSAPHAERDIRVVASDPVRDLYAARSAPNHRWISFNAVDPKNGAVSTIYAADLKGGSWTAISDRGAWDDKSRWAPDGRAIYYVSSQAGLANVWGRRFDPVIGRPIGAAFAVTDFATPRQTPSAQGMEIVVTRNRLVVPITEASSDIWILDTAAR